MRYERSDLGTRRKLRTSSPNSGENRSAGMSVHNRRNPHRLNIQLQITDRGRIFMGETTTDLTLRPEIGKAWDYLIAAIEKLEGDSFIGLSEEAKSALKQVQTDIQGAIEAIEADAENS